MKKFSDIKKIRRIKRINENDISLNAAGITQDTPENQNASTPEGEETTVEPTETPTEGNKVKKFFSKLFESREMAHIYHLQVKDKGLASHLALNDYYEGVIDLIDTLIEVWQGQFGIVEGYEIIDTKETTSKDKIEYFEQLASFIKTERKCISPEDTHLHNIIDEIVALIFKTLYKLKYL